MIESERGEDLPNIWFQHPKEGHRIKTKKEFFVVDDAQYLESYHYHGSHFEHTWRIVGVNRGGNKTHMKLSTDSSYTDKELIGNMIVKNDSFFELITR